MSLQVVTLVQLDVREFCLSSLPLPSSHHAAANTGWLDILVPTLSWKLNTCFLYLVSKNSGERLLERFLIGQ